MTNRKLDSEVVMCISCGRPIEFFTDEVKRRCRCGQLMLRESLPKCADWCMAADRCLGEAIDPRELERRLSLIKDDPRAKECLEKIRARMQEKQAGGQPD